MYDLPTLINLHLLGTRFTLDVAAPVIFTFTSVFDFHDLAGVSPATTHGPAASRTLTGPVTFPTTQKQSVIKYKTQHMDLQPL